MKRKLKFPQPKAPAYKPKPPEHSKSQSKFNTGLAFNQWRIHRNNELR